MSEGDRNGGGGTKLQSERGRERDPKRMTKEAGGGGEGVKESDKDQYVH